MLNQSVGVAGLRAGLIHCPGDNLVEKHKPEFLVASQ